MDHNDVARAKAQAAADLAAAEADAALLLAELGESVPAAGSRYKMPSMYGPGEGPRDPAASVAPSSSDAFSDIFGDHGFNPNWRESSLPDVTQGVPSSGNVNFAQKVKDAQAPRGNA